MDNIKVVQLNAGIGESSAPNRLHLALKKIGINTKIITMQSNVNDKMICVLKKGFLYRIFRKVDSILCKLEFSKQYNLKEEMPFSYYRVGESLSKQPEIKEADLIELHWICGSFLSLRGVKKILSLKKPVIIVCHDNWHFTGGCHVRMGCEKYKKHCEQCPQLESRIQKDCSYRLFEQKRKVFSGGNITVVSPSRWMDQNVAGSSLLGKFPHYAIPNALNTEVFRPLDKLQMREKYGIPQEALVLAYGAVNSIKTPYKGYAQLLTALELFQQQFGGKRKIIMLVFGSKKEENCQEKGYEIRYMGYLNEKEMVEMYNCTDIYIVPSLEDSFNYTVAESLACETPVVSFATGGIVDIIDHKESGYLAEYNNPARLAEGINWVCNHNQGNVLGKAGRKKVIKCFSEEVVAKQFEKLYKQLLEKTNG